MAINLRREQSDFQVTEVDPISKASQDYLKAEKEIEDLEALMKVKKESNDSAQVFYLQGVTEY